MWFGSMLVRRGFVLVSAWKPRSVLLVPEQHVTMTSYLRLNHNNIRSIRIQLLGHHVAKSVVFLAMDVLAHFTHKLSQLVSGMLACVT